MELMSNHAQTRLASGLSSGATTCSLLSASGFPTTGTFRIVIDAELIKVTGISGTTLTIVRGQEGTTDATHASGQFVTVVTTAESLENFRGDSFARGLYASRPAAGNAGRLYLATDSPYLSRDNGSGWDEWGPIFAITRPVLADYTWFNQGDATAVDSGAGIRMSKPTASGEDTRILERAVPSTPYTFTAMVIPQIVPDNYSGCGICIRNSVSGKIVQNHWIGIANQYYVTNRYMNSATSFNSDGTLLMMYPNSRIFLRITDNGTTRRFYYSLDGGNWNEFANDSHTNFFTPDKIGLFIWGQNQPSAATFLSVLIE